MSYIDWDESKELGHDQIDAEHRGVLIHINRLVDLVFVDEEEGVRNKGGEGRHAHIETAVTALRTAAAEHFRSEEALMIAAGFPARTHHIEQHVELLQELDRFADHFHSTRADSLAHAVRFLREWWEFHIGSYDRALVRWLKTGDSTPVRSAEE